MTLLEFETHFKTLATVISILIALIGHLRNQRQKQLVTANIWALFIKQQNNYAMTQAVLRLYKERHSDNLDKEVLEWASKAESFDQHIFEDIINQIYVSDNKLTLEKVNRYFNENKISAYDKKLFEMMINEPPIFTFTQKAYKFLGIPI